MILTMTSLCDLKVEAILAALGADTFRPKAAIVRLVAAGMARAEAEELILTALGGGDLIEIGADGIERFGISRRLVSEIETEMGR